MQYYEQQLIPGDEINEAMRVANGSSDDQWSRICRFVNSWTIRVTVRRNELTAVLYDQAGLVVDNLQEEDVLIDRQFYFYHQEDRYCFEIIRAAKRELTDLDIGRYANSIGHHCPFCRSGELHFGKAIEGDAGMLIRGVTCCNCDARWKNYYAFDCMGRDFTGPQTNVMCDEEEDSDLSFEEG